MKLFPFQAVGAAYLAARRFALLADTMGLGKTAQAVRAVDLAQAVEVLVLCPGVARTGWVREFHRWSPLGHTTTPLYAGKDLVPSGVAVCSYDLAIGKAMRAKLLSRRWDALIIDESHYLKERTAARTRLVYGKRCDRVGGLAGQATHIWCLSGTPMPNNPSELWPMLNAAGYGGKGYHSFLRATCTGYHTDYGYQVTGVKNAPALRQAVSQIMLRRTWDDVEQELPSLTYRTHYVSPTEVDPMLFLDRGWDRDPEAMRAALSRDAALVGGLLHIKNIADRTRALTAAASGVAQLRRYVGLSKVSPVAELVTQLLADDPAGKVVLFAYHRDVLLLLQLALAAHKPQLYWGGLAARKKERHVHHFINKPHCRVFLAQIQAAGTALDGLQKVANTVVIAEPSWSPAENAQAVMRVHRNGQARPVKAFFVSAAGTIDEQVVRVLRRKTEMLAEVIDNVLL